MEKTYAYQFETKEDLLEFIRQNVLLGTEVVEETKVSKARVNQKVADGVLKPIKDKGKAGRLYFRPDVEEEARNSRPGRPKTRTTK